jgi:hypothetical protein
LTIVETSTATASVATHRRLLSGHDGKQTVAEVIDDL